MLLYLFLLICFLLFLYSFFFLLSYFFFIMFLFAFFFLLYSLLFFFLCLRSSLPSSSFLPSFLPFFLLFFLLTGLGRNWARAQAGPGPKLGPGPRRARIQAAPVPSQARPVCIHRGRVAPKQGFVSKEQQLCWIIINFGKIFIEFIDNQVFSIII